MGAKLDGMIKEKKHPNLICTAMLDAKIVGDRLIKEQE